MRVAIIGAGPSGLASIKSCLEENLQPVCFEQENSLGGLWNFTENHERHSSVYKSTVINTCKEMTCFSDFPVPAEFPMFMPHTDVLRYLHLYAARFDLYQYIRFNTTVVRVTKREDHSTTGKWQVQYQGTGVEACTETVGAVLVCSGHHWCPSWPSFPGMDAFTGSKIHSHSYKDHQGFEDKNVLVVGLGNSAADIATELSHHASKVYLSTRRGAWVMSRLAARGEPWDFWYETRFRNLFPKGLTQWLLTGDVQGRFDHANYGVLPKHGINNAPTVISDDLPHRIANGTLAIKPNISHFTENGVVFEGGDEVENLDAVVFCTGYQVKFPFLVQDIVRVRDNQVTLYKYMFPPDHAHPTLAIIGLTQSSGSMVPLVETQARLAVRVFTRAVTLPSRREMLRDVERKKEEMRQTFYRSNRLTLQVSSISYKDELADLIGCKPSLWKLLFTHPALGYRCLFGPCTPAQYRLTGPGAWPGAKHTIEHAHERLFTKRVTAMSLVSIRHGNATMTSSSILRSLRSVHGCYKAFLDEILGALGVSILELFKEGLFIIFA